MELINVSRAQRRWDSQCSANRIRPNSWAGVLVDEVGVGCVHTAPFAFDNQLQYGAQDGMPRGGDDRPLAKVYKIFEGDAQGFPTHLPQGERDQTSRINIGVNASIFVEHGVSPDIG